MEPTIPLIPPSIDDTYRIPVNYSGDQAMRYCRCCHEEHLAILFAPIQPDTRDLTGDGIDIACRFGRALMIARNDPGVRR
jgi:hypothetical protein